MTQCLGAQCLHGPEGRSQGLLSLWSTPLPGGSSLYPACPFLRRQQLRHSPAFSSSASNLNGL